MKIIIKCDDTTIVAKFIELCNYKLYIFNDGNIHRIEYSTKPGFVFTAYLNYKTLVDKLFITPIAMELTLFDMDDKVLYEFKKMAP